MGVEELARQLCVHVGMIMEDASVGAILTGTDAVTQVTALRLASYRIAALVNAAEALIAE